MVNTLDNWIFTKNSHTNNWRACTRNEYLTLFSSPEEKFLRAEHFQDLVDLILYHKGDEETLKKLI
jgi:hypothetical protein